MKFYILSTFFVMITVSSQMSFAMDDPQTMVILDTSPSSLQERVIFADNAINKKYKDIFKKLSHQPFTEKKMNTVLKIVNNSFQGNTSDQFFIHELIKKNMLFMSTIDYFCEFATKNIEKVTAENLKTINDHEKEQPIKKLNKLPLPIKKYIMKRAYNQVGYIYSIIFEGHTDTVESMDVNQPSNLAASASKDKTFCLWQLSNGKLLHVFDTTAHQGYVKFSPDGSLLATSTVYKINPYKAEIILWNTLSKKALYRFKEKERIINLNIFPISSERATVLIGKKHHLSVYSLKKNSQPTFLGNTTGGIKTKEDRMPYANTENNHCWSVSRVSRRLGLCDYALKNTDNKHIIPAIKETPTYEKLTDHEKDILHVKMEQKIQALESNRLSKFHTLMS